MVSATVAVNVVLLLSVTLVCGTSCSKPSLPCSFGSRRSLVPLVVLTLESPTTEFFSRGFPPASAVFFRRLTPLLRVDDGVCSACPGSLFYTRSVPRLGFLFCTRSIPRLGFLVCTRSIPRLGRFLKGGYAPPFGAEWSKAAVGKLEFDALNGSVRKGEAIDRVRDEDGVIGVGVAVGVDRVD